MKVKYILEDSGRTLVNKLTLQPGVEYQVSDGEVRYAEGVKVIGKELAEKLIKSKVLEVIPEPAPVEVGPPAVEPKAEKPTKAKES